MKFYFITILFISLILFFGSCATSKKIEALKPEPEAVESPAIETATSFLSMPISIQLKDIENQTNKYLQGLIYDDNNLEDDDMMVKVWKKAPIAMRYENGKIKTILPLRAQIIYRYGISKLGINLQDTREFNLEGTVALLSDITLTNWQLFTKTSLEKIDWDESPTVTIAGKNISITYLVNPAIKIFKSKIEKNIDESVKKTMDFKPQVISVLDKIAQPIKVSDNYESWFRLIPIELYANDAKLNKNDVNIAMGLKCKMETFVGKTPDKIFESDKIVLKAVSKFPERVTANIVGISTYKDASSIITKNFKGQEFSNGSRKITIENVSIWHKKGKMIIALDTKGSINGTIYLSGYPQYNMTTKEIYFDDLEYVLDTKNKLMKTANWLLQGIILNKIRENCRYSIQANMDEGKKNILSYLNNYSPMKGVFVNGNLSSFEFKKVSLTTSAIVAFIEASGEMNIKINGLD